MGLFATANAPRETSVAAIQALHAAGVQVVMLTGDTGPPPSESPASWASTR
jgi:cation transport ATPase